MKTLLALALFLGLAAAAVAQDSAFALGQGGFWWRAGVPHTRERVEYQAGWYLAANGCRTYYPASFSYQYTATTYAPLVLPAVAPRGWRDQLLTIASAREDQLAYEASIKLLGLNRGYASPGYGSLNLSAFSTSGSTQYGYSVANALDLYGRVDLNQQMLKVAQLAELSASNGKLLIDGHAELVSQSAADARALAELQLKAAAVKAILDPPPTSSSVNLKANIGPAPAPAIEPLPGLSPEQVNQLWSFSAQKCIACHGEKKQEGGFSVLKIDWLDEAARARVLARIHPAAEAKVRMPRLLDGSAGAPIGDEEHRIWRLRLGLKTK